jgi:adenylate cyclase
MGYRGGPATGHLLVVDDNKVNRLLLGRGLEQQGHTVAFAENGREALELLRSRSFDMVLLDIQMPEMDGYQVLERITSDLHLRDIPVIMTTATEELNSVVRCIEMGAEDYLTKPVNPVLLRARINASLEKKRLRDQQRELIRKFATAEVAEDLQESGFALGGKFVEATAMFSDIRGFTTIAESQSPADTIDLLNTYYTLMFEAICGQSGIVNQMVGDGLMAIFGAPLPLDNRCEHTVLAALEMIEMVELFNLDQAAQGKVQIRIGIGIASGQVIAGYTGTLRRATYTCVGDTVNLAARLEAHTKVVGQPILIDETTRQGLRAAIQVVDQGKLQLKGKTQAVRVFSVPEGQEHSWS